jgi:Zn-dependent protease
MTLTIQSVRFEFRAGFLLPLVPLVLIAVVRLGWSAGFLGTGLFILCVLAHEFGHALFAILNGTRISAFGLCAWGAYLRREKAESYAEIAISAAGPLVSLLIAILFWNGTGMLRWLAEMNMMLFGLNVLPIWGSDGKRILASIRELSSARPARNIVVIEPPQPQE